MILFFIKLYHESYGYIKNEYFLKCKIIQKEENRKKRIN